MRILISSTSYYPYISGVSVFARHSAQHLANSGHDVFVIAPDKSSHMHREHKPDQNVLVIRVPSYPNPFHRHFRVPVLTPGSIRTLLQELKPDVIHVQDPLPFNLLLVSCLSLESHCSFSLFIKICARRPTALAVGGIAPSS